DHDGDLDAVIRSDGDLLGHPGDDIGVQADAAASEDLSGQLQQDAAVRGIGGAHRMLPGLVIGSAGSIMPQTVAGSRVRSDAGPGSAERAGAGVTGCQAPTRKRAYPVIVPPASATN